MSPYYTEKSASWDIHFKQWVEYLCGESAYIQPYHNRTKNIINKLVNVKNIFKQQHANSQEHSNVVFQNALVVSN